MMKISERIVTEIMGIGNVRGLTQAKLAKLFDCTPAYITQLKQGTKSPSLSFLDKVEKKMKIKFYFQIETAADRKYHKEVQKEIDKLLGKN